MLFRSYDWYGDFLTLSSLNKGHTEPSPQGFYLSQERFREATDEKDPLKLLHYRLSQWVSPLWLGLYRPLWCLSYGKFVGKYGLYDCFWAGNYSADALTRTFRGLFANRSKEKA